ncbi:MAG: hypothetical protein ACO1OB_26310 [Archangium sp.]
MEWDGGTPVKLSNITFASEQAFLGEANAPLSVEDPISGGTTMHGVDLRDASLLFFFFDFEDEGLIVSRGIYAPENGSYAFDDETVAEADLQAKIDGYRATGHTCASANPEAAP